MPLIGRGGSSPPSDTTKWESSHLLEPEPRSAPTTDTVPADPRSATIPRVPPATADTDLTALQRVLGATAVQAAARTVRAMPNAAPPKPAAARRRAAAPPTVPTASASDAPPHASSAAPSRAPAGLPSSWAGFGALLDDAGERVPVDALTLTAVASAAGKGAEVDLSGIWSLPAEMAAARSHTVLRALDVKGRLMLPLEVAAAARVPAERDGAVLTVFLPGSADRPRPNFAVAPLPLDARGRLTLTAGVRRAAGIPDGADV